MSTPRAYTKEEMRQMFLDHTVGIVRYWQTVKTNDPFGGILHSLMVFFDGNSGMMPAFIITPDPHPEDEEYHKSEGENWWVREPINGDGVSMKNDLLRTEGYKLDSEKLRNQIRREFYAKVEGAPSGTPKHQQDVEEAMLDEIIRLRGM